MSYRRSFGCAWLICFLFAAACQAEPDVRAADTSHTGGRDHPSETIYVASNGWHSAVFVSRSALAPGALPEITDFPEARYLGFGWGDAEYFPARDPGFSLLLSAALWPTPAVLHVTGLRISPRAAYPKDEVIELKISPGAFRKLVAYLDSTFARGENRFSKPIGPGLDPNSRFYRAKGEFHMFNTCNSWTARGLAAAGVAIDPDGVIRAEDLMAQLRALNRVKHTPK